MNPNVSEVRNDVFQQSSFFTLLIILLFPIKLMSWLALVETAERNKIIQLQSIKTDWSNALIKKR